MEIKPPLLIPKNKTDLFSKQLKLATAKDCFSTALRTCNIRLDITDKGYTISDFDSDASELVTQAIKGLTDQEILSCDGNGFTHIIKDGSHVKLPDRSLIKVARRVLTDHRNLLPTFLGLDPDLDKAIGLLIK